MESIAALSLAANVIQIVDFAQKILSAGRQIHRAGSTLQNAEVEVVLLGSALAVELVTGWVKFANESRDGL